MELTSLMVCVALGNREGFKAFHQANMEDGKADVRELDESFYLKLLVSAPSYMRWLPQVRCQVC